MLSRNMNQANNRCNNTRLQVGDYGTNVLSTTNITNKNIGNKTFIPGMSLIPSNYTCTFKFQRQFPVSLCFAMMINKSQGQQLSNVGLYLSCIIFTYCL
uniref:ATP-dependent DNA helicase PIF1 n=1 Tax=Cajanus cajan TaxID=3821 RepID=A0A151S205_CAJCA|nr:hypothetical protein KK1_029527 [Cajanus cajan]